jgi:hypothetical protein
MRNSSILNDPPVTLFFLAIATALSTVVCISLASKEATPVSFAICQPNAFPSDRRTGLEQCFSRLDSTADIFESLIR